jgi:hypothetical protein
MSIPPSMLLTTHAPLAQSDAAPGAIFWSAIVIACCVGLFWVLSVVRKRIKDVPASDVPAAGFTLGDLRELHRSGQMTDEEFERARAKIVAAGKRVAAQVPDPLAGRRNPPSSPPSSRPE